MSRKRRVFNARKTSLSVFLPEPLPSDATTDELLLDVALYGIAIVDVTKPPRMPQVQRKPTPKPSGGKT